MGVMGSKDWLKAKPSPGLGTHMQDRNFRLWFKYYCRVPLFDGDERCPRQGCNAVVDQYGDHLLHCPNAMRQSVSPRIWRHNSQVHLLCSDLRKAARQPLLEPREGGQHTSRPDIRTLGATGGSDYLDVTIVHPLSSPTRINSSIRKPQGTLNKAHSEKERKHQTFIERMGPGSRIVPILVTTLGGWHPSAHRYVRALADELAARAMINRGRCRAALFQRHAARLVQNNVRCLMEGVVCAV